MPPWAARDQTGTVNIDNFKLSWPPLYRRSGLSVSVTDSTSQQPILDFRVAAASTS
jgi:hypothetical protein